MTTAEQTIVKNKEMVEHIGKCLQELGESDVMAIQEACESRKSELVDERLRIETRGWSILSFDEMELYRDQILSRCKASGPHGRQLTEDEQFELCGQVTWYIVDKMPEKISSELEYILRKNPSGLVIRKESLK